MGSPETKLARSRSHASEEASDVGSLHVVSSRLLCCCECVSCAALVAVRATEPVGVKDCSGGACVPCARFDLRRRVLEALLGTSLKRNEENRKKKLLHILKSVIYISIYIVVAPSSEEPYCIYRYITDFRIYGKSISEITIHRYTNP